MSFFNKDGSKVQRAVDPENQYWNRSIFYKLSQRVKFWTIDSERLTVDIFAMSYYPRVEDRLTDSKVYRYERRDTWTKRSPEELNRDGYYRVDGLYDSIIFWGVPVYIKLHGLRKFDIKTVNDKGELIYSQDTSATLHDVMQSSATQDFIKGMGKTTMAAMDTQKIIMIAILGAGVIFGLYMLGII